MVDPLVSQRTAADLPNNMGLICISHYHLVTQNSHVYREQASFSVLAVLAVSLFRNTSSAATASPESLCLSRLMLGALAGAMTPKGLS